MSSAAWAVVGYLLISDRNSSAAFIIILIHWYIDTLFSLLEEPCLRSDRGSWPQDPWPVGHVSCC
jgi:hypothetical protein